MAKLVDAQSSGGCAFGRAGSSPVPGTSKPHQPVGFFCDLVCSEKWFLALATLGTALLLFHGPRRRLRSASTRQACPLPTRWQTRGHCGPMQCGIKSASLGGRTAACIWWPRSLFARGTLETPHPTQQLRRPRRTRSVLAHGSPTRETGMQAMTEVATPAHVEAALKAGMTALWIGARTTVSPFAVQALADALRGSDVTRVGQKSDACRLEVVDGGD